MALTSSGANATGADAAWSGDKKPCSEANETERRAAASTTTDEIVQVRTSRAGLRPLGRLPPGPVRSMRRFAIVKNRMLQPDGRWPDLAGSRRRPTLMVRTIRNRTESAGRPTHGTASKIG